MNWAYVFNEVAPSVEAIMGLTPGSIDLGALGLGTVIPFGANLAYFNSASSRPFSTTTRAWEII